MRPRKLSFPSIENPLTSSDSSGLFRRLNENDRVSPDSNDRVKSWLFVQSSDHHRTNSTSIIEISDSHVNPDENVRKESLPPLTNGNLVRLRNPRVQQRNNAQRMSLSSTKSSSTDLRSSIHSPFVFSTGVVRFRTQSMDLPESVTGSTSSKDRMKIPSTFLHFHPSFNEFDRKKIEEIRQQLSDDFDEYLPILIRLGILCLSESFFHPRGKEWRQREHFIDILEKDYRNEQHQHHLERIFSLSCFGKDLSISMNRLRENLSHQGQLSLLAAYRDEIENEFNKKIRSWKSIRMKSMFFSSIDESSSRLKKFPKIISQEEFPSIYRPDQFDSQWKRKLIGFIIEQGMKILDEVRNLPVIRSSSDQQNVIVEELVRKFKRWIFIWFTLFNED